MTKDEASSRLQIAFINGLLSNPLINSIAGRPVKNDEMQGGRILGNEAYNQYAAMTKDEAQRRRSRFSTARLGPGRLDARVPATLARPFRIESAHT